MKKNKYDIDDLLGIIRKLRSPKGCPWDRKQTHKSIRTHLVEETYEFVDAVNSGDLEHMKEELGDVLLHVVFHADIERAKGNFGFLEVTDSISRKLIRRHPHVFKNVKISGVNDIIKNWEEIKAGESTKQDRRFVMDRVPESMPAMAKTQKVLHLARNAGFKVQEDIKGKTGPQMRIFQSSLDGKSGKREKQKALGKLLFGIIDLSEKSGLDAEDALGEACKDFIKHHNKIESRLSVGVGLARPKSK